MSRLLVKTREPKMAKKIRHDTPRTISGSKLDLESKLNLAAFNGKDETYSMRLITEMERYAEITNGKTYHYSACLTHYEYQVSTLNDKCGCKFRKILMAKKFVEQYLKEDNIALLKLQGMSDAMIMSVVKILEMHITFISLQN